MKCDPEMIEDQLLTLVQSKLPDKLVEISDEKNDSIILDIPKDKEYFNTTDDQVDNRKMSVQYGLIDGSPLSIGSNTAEDYRYMFLIYINEMNAKPGINRKKLYRYIRALKEIFEENFKRFPHLSTLKVETIAPTSASWDENEISPTYKVGGVFINTSLAG